MRIYGPKSIFENSPSKSVVIHESPFMQEQKSGSGEQEGEIETTLSLAEDVSSKTSNRTSLHSIATSGNTSLHLVMVEIH